MPFCDYLSNLNMFDILKWKRQKTIYIILSTHTYIVVKIQKYGVFAIHQYVLSSLGSRML